MWQVILDSAYEQALSYNVDPLIFTAIYLGGIPLFWVAAWWLRQRYNEGESPYLPILAMAYLLVQPYLYVLLFGENLPWWAYGAVITLIGFAGWTLYAKVEAARDA